MQNVGNLATILADMVRSALAWEEAHGMPPDEGASEPDRALTTAIVVYRVDSDDGTGKGGR